MKGVPWIRLGGGTQDLPGMQGLQCAVEVQWEAWEVLSTSQPCWRRCVHRARASPAQSAGGALLTGGGIGADVHGVIAL